MGLSRLENFLKNIKGEVLYVDPSSLDSTDAIDNQGNSLARPFKTIQRALIEASRFSYQVGLDNDRFGKTTIMVYPGEHIVDNRPGWIPISSGNYRLRNGTSSTNFFEFDTRTNFDVTDSSNDLYKLNSVKGGVIVPRGTSLVGMDLRKTKIIPTYVPDPENDDIERSAIFRLTGGCYLWQFSIFDGDPNGTVFKDYTLNKFVPNFSHHKLTVFEYADGVNDLDINDTFLTYSTTRTDLEIYYEKIGLAYGSASGREIAPDYPSANIDIQPTNPEFEIVGNKGDEVGITSIFAGDSVTASPTITVLLKNDFPELNVDTPIRIAGVNALGYNGSFNVTKIVSDTEIQYQLGSSPFDPSPNLSGTSPTLNVVVDTVNGASPYIFNISLRSVFGMCGMHADGSKATGFKSMVVAQFTGISLQKDDKAFVKYNESTGAYDDSTTIATLHTDPLAVYKPAYSNFHIKSSNDAFLQLVSIFAIGYSTQFLTESGGDQSVTNSNSNFGAISLASKGSKLQCFERDDAGFITHVISPKENVESETAIEYYSVDVGITTSVANTGRLYLYQQTNEDVPPDSVFDGYRVGAKNGDLLNVVVNNSGASADYTAKISMAGTTSVSYKKQHKVGRTGTTNDISNISPYVITLQSAHNFVNGESVRILSEDGSLPDGIKPDQVYFVITSGNGITNPGANKKIKLAETLNDALNDVSISLNSAGGVLTVESRVSDKISGDIGHPVQYDSSVSNWYINVFSANNDIYSQIAALGTGSLGAATPRSFFNRTPDTRNIQDKIFKFRYVIPKNSKVVARQPLDGFILQDSSNSSGFTDSEIARYYTPETVTLSSENELRNVKLIKTASWSSDVSTYTSELPHGLFVGDKVRVKKIKSSQNTTGKDNEGFNGSYIVVSTPTTKVFTVAETTNPGTFSNTNDYLRDDTLPRFSKKESKNTYYAYQWDEVQQYISGQKDGIYHLTAISASINPTVAPFNTDEYKFSQPLQNLFPEYNRDNVNSSPRAATSHAQSSPIGQVVVNDPELSVTKENLKKYNSDFSVGIGVSDLNTNAGVGNTISTKIHHGLNRITAVNVGTAGTGYGDGVERIYYNAVLTGGSGVDATASVKVNASGSITDVKIMDGGSNYVVGDTLTVVGIATTAGHTAGTLTVDKIYDNVGDIVHLEGITKNELLGFEQTYLITGVNNGYQFSADALDTIGISTTGISSAINDDTTVTLVGRSVGISTLGFNATTGIASITTKESHGFSQDEKVRVRGFTADLYNGDFLVDEVTSTTTFNVNLGVSTVTPAVGVNNPLAFRLCFSSGGGNITKRNESVSGRITPIYAGITTTLSAAITDQNTETIGILSATNYDFNVGDYLEIDDEIVRIKTSVTSNSVTAFRGLLGTKRATHLDGSVVRRIEPKAIELRRFSIIRASGHTFEYLGYGPGNYSTSLPEKQTRQLTPQEEIISQSFKRDAGAVVFTGMNDDGDFYVGNKRVSASSGNDRVFETPLVRVTGENTDNVIDNLGGNVLDVDAVTIDDTIRVEGGPDSTSISEFNGPIVINNKLTSNSPKGMEAKSLFLQGDSNVSRKYTVGIATPTLAGNPGDVVFKDKTAEGGALGWVYTLNNDWREFGPVKDATGNYTGTFSGTFFGNANGLTGASDIWVADSIGIHTTSKVGVATDTALADFGLFVNGGIRADGVTQFNTSHLDLNITTGLYVNTGITTFASTVEITGATTFTGGGTIKSDLTIQNDVADANGKNVTFKNTDTTSTSGQRIGGLQFESGDTGNDGIRGYIYGIYEGTQGQTALSFGVQSATGAANPVEALRLASDGNATFSGTVTASSDVRLKENVTGIENALDKVLDLRGVYFNRIGKTYDDREVGVIAQEVEKVLPELVKEGADGMKSVAYQNLVAVLIEAVKDLKAEVDNLKSGGY